MDNQLAGLLGICRRSGHLIAGFDAAAKWIKQRRAVLVLLASDLSAKTAKEIHYYACGMETPPLTLPCTMEALAAAVGAKKPIGVAAVDDSGFAVAIQQHIPAESKEDDAL